MVDMVDPKLGEKILDPACGTGGFLTCAVNNIRKNYVKSIEDEEKLQKSISGVEKKPCRIFFASQICCFTELRYRRRYATTTPGAPAAGLWLG